VSETRREPTLLLFDGGWKASAKTLRRDFSSVILFSAASSTQRPIQRREQSR
jgi:hypothetical protein